jgi:hypothetical protein
MNKAELIAKLADDAEITKLRQTLLSILLLKQLLKH